MNRYRSDGEVFIPMHVATGYIIWVPANPLSRNPRLVDRLIEEEYGYTVVENISISSRFVGRSKGLWERVIGIVSRTFRKAVESIWISRAP
ncbi:MAG: hypothetical protein QXE01_06035 [Sulfolobales archaeon]